MDYTAPPSVQAHFAKIGIFLRSQVSLGALICRVTPLGLNQQGYTSFGSPSDCQLQPQGATPPKNNLIPETCLHT